MHKTYLYHVYLMTLISNAVRVTVLANGWGEKLHPRHVCVALRQGHRVKRGSKAAHIHTAIRLLWDIRCKGSLMLFNVSESLFLNATINLYFSKQSLLSLAHKWLFFPKPKAETKSLFSKWSTDLQSFLK